MTIFTKSKKYEVEFSYAQQIGFFNPDEVTVIVHFSSDEFELDWEKFPRKYKAIFNGGAEYIFGEIVNKYYRE